MSVLIAIGVIAKGVLKGTGGKSMEALSLKQPSAWAVVKGLKDIENRKWPTAFRGELLIHASMNWGPMGEIILRVNGIEPPSQKDLAFHFGGIVGKVTVIDCVRSHPSKWFFGPWGFVLDNAMELERPIALKGQLGFFTVPEDVIKEAKWRTK